MVEKQNKETSRGSFGGDDIDRVILHGVTFKGAGKGPKRDDTGKVKTKAKKKSYITGAHGSASARRRPTSGVPVPTGTRNKEAAVSIILTQPLLLLLVELAGPSAVPK